MGELPSAAPVPLQTSQAFKPRDANLGLEPGRGFFERDLDVVPEVGAAARPCAPARSRAEDLAEAEEVAQYVFEAREALSEARARPGARADARVAEAVVARAQFG